MASLTGFKLIVAIVAKGEAGKAMKAARRAGAEGGTILLARGTGVHEARTFLGLTLSSEREVLLTLVDPKRADEVLRAVVATGRLGEPARGIAFVLPVDEVRGIVHRESGG